MGLGVVVILVKYATHGIVQITRKFEHFPN